MRQKPGVSRTQPGGERTSCMLGTFKAQWPGLAKGSPGVSELSEVRRDSAATCSDEEDVEGTGLGERRTARGGLGSTHVSSRPGRQSRSPTEPGGRLE